MKLRRLSAISLAGSLIGLLALAAFSVVAVNLLANHMQHAERVTQVRAQVEKINVALDYVTLLRSDPHILVALSEDADRLAALVQELGHPLSTPAAIHLNELAHLARKVGELSPDSSLLHSDQQQRDSLMAVVTQMLIHRGGVTDVINTMASEQQETLYLQVMATAGALVTGALLIAVLSMFGFTVLHHRLSKPMDALEQGLRAVAAGDLGARIDIHGRDELAQLGTLFNQMVYQRQVHESELTEKEQRFRQLAENIDEVFWMTDPEKNEMLYISPAFEHIWGFSPDALYRDPDLWLQAIHPDDRDRVHQALPEQATGTYRQEYRITRPDGMERCILDRAFPIRDASGQVYRIAGVALDLTDQRQIEADLQERVKELGCIYRVLELTTDTEQETRSICADVTAVLPNGFLESGHAVARITMGQDECTSPGWEPPLERLQSPILVEGRQVGLVEVGYKASRPPPPQEREAFLAEEKVLLDSVAQHLGRMLHTRQLSQAMARSERLSAVGQLTGGVAHDFNNLLTVIIGNSELLQLRLAKEDRLRKLVDMIATAANRGAELTQRLLSVARAQALEPRVINVNELLSGMEALLQRSLGETIELNIIRESRLWPALVDPGQLENAILNLCINARDAMPKGGRLTLETARAVLDESYTVRHAEVRPGDYVLITVSDTGQGIPAELQEKVFEPFFTTKGEAKGTGLGLSTVHGFVKQSRGHISLYSEPGQGTTVRLYLPRAALNEQTVRPNPDDQHPRGGDEVILLVEDDRLVRRYAEEQLSNLGYTVLVASNGRDALAMIRENPGIDLLFTDVVMPGGMNGQELAEAARQVRPGLRVLYTSGYTGNAIVHQGHVDPGVLLLTKPYRQAELARKLREALAQPGQPTGDDPHETPT